MGYKSKMGEGIDAAGYFMFAQVINAVKNVADEMGENAVEVYSVNESNGTIWLSLFKTGAQKIMNFNVIDAITKEPDMSASVKVEQAGDGRQAVSVNIGEAKTTRQVLLGFIPISPKSVHGITTYRDFCGHLKAELAHIDPSAQITQRGQQ